MRKLLTIVFSGFFFLHSFSQLSMPRIFGNSMVLQRNVQIPFWGNATPKSTIEISINNQTKIGKADSTGHWKLQLDSMPAGGPYICTITENQSGSQIIFNDVMIGDVWLASGQSNMELKLSESTNGKTEISQAQFPNIRVFKVPHCIETKPQTDVLPASWQVCDSISAASFSAVAYYFAKYITTAEKVPVGIIQATWGGSPVEGWTSTEQLATVPEQRKRIDEINTEGVNKQSFYADSANEKRFFDIIYKSLNGEKQGVTGLSYNDSSWKPIVMPKNICDSVPLQQIWWLHKTIDVPQALAARPFIINLGYPEILYSLYINGTAICTNRWNAQKQHVYTIPAGIFKAGKNVVCVRLCVMWGGGGFDQPADSMFISSGLQCISLAGEWKYADTLETKLPVVKNYHKYPSFH